MPTIDRESFTRLTNEIRQAVMQLRDSKGILTGVHLDLKYRDYEKAAIVALTVCSPYPVALADEYIFNINYLGPNRY